MMDSFEWNKILGAALGTVLFIVALNILLDEVMAPEKPTSPGMEVAVTETPTSGGPVAEVKPDWGTVLPTADVAAGEKIHQRCLQCHDFEKGGPNKIGPNLYGVVGGKHAHKEDYAYSGAMKGIAGPWGYDELDAFLTNPRGAVPGTKMTFAGLSKQSDRINLIAWMRTKSDSPASIPAPNPAAAQAPAAAAGGPDGEGPSSQTQTPPGGGTAPGAAPPTAPTGGTPPATPGPATPAPASGVQAPGQSVPPPPAAQPAPATPPGH